MERPEAFREDLEDLLTLASASDYRLTRKQVEDTFDDFTLSDDQMEMIYQFLAKNGIDVEEENKPEEKNAGDTQAGSDKEKTGKSGSAKEQPGTRQEEREEDSAYYRMYMSDLAALSPFSKHEEERLLKRLLAGEASVGQALIEGRLRFAARTAALYRGQGVPLMDLIQEANMALILAVSKYTGGSFEELILAEIQQTIENALVEAGNAADVGNHLASQVNSLMIVTARLAEELGREATLEELSERMHMPQDSVRQLVKMAMDAMTLQEDERISPELS